MVGGTTIEGDAAAKARQEAGSELCRSCGMCCDGTLFGHVPVTSEEAHRLRHRLPIVRASGERGERIEQMCAALGPRGCDVYAERPAPCATYRCKLLVRVEAAEVSLARAHEVVSTLRALLDRTDSGMPRGRSLHARKNALSEVGDSVTAALGAGLDETWRDLHQLDALIASELESSERSIDLANRKS